MSMAWPRSRGVRARVAGLAARASVLYRRPMTTVTIADEGKVARAPAELAGEDLWLAAPVLRESTGWELRSAGFCPGPVCVPIPPGRQTEVVRDHGAGNPAALARHRGH